MKNRQKGFASVLLIVVGLLVVAGGIFWYSKSNIEVVGGQDPDTNADNLISTTTAQETIIKKGVYTFNEYHGRDQDGLELKPFVYILSLKNDNGSGPISLTINLNQFGMVILNASGVVRGSSIDVVFDSYGPGSKVTNAYKNGDILFTLKPANGAVLLEWKKLQPDEKDTGEISTFVKTSN